MDYNHIQQNLNQISTLSQASDTNVKNKRVDCVDKCVSVKLEYYIGVS